MRRNWSFQVTSDDELPMQAGNILLLLPSKTEIIECLDHFGSLSDFQINCAKYKSMFTERPPTVLKIL